MSAEGGAGILRRLAPWAVAACVAVAWHGVWFAWLVPLPDSVRIGFPKAASVRLRPLPGGQPVRGSDGDVWSPALFALPSPAGFSRAMLTNSIGVRPPVSWVAIPPSSLARPSVPPPSPLDGWSRRIGENVAQSVTNFVTREPSDPVFTLGLSTAAVVAVDFTGEFEGQYLDGFAVPELTPECLQQSWETSATVETDGNGNVMHVFIEQRSPSETFDVRLIRSLMKARVTNARGAVEGRVVVRCVVPVRREARSP